MPPPDFHACNNRWVEFALFRSWCLILYGSANPAQQNENEFNQFPSSPSPAYNNNTIYRIKSQNYKNKQQQLQKVTVASTPSSLPSSPPRKSGKQKNKSGKNSQRVASSTTSRPSYTTVMLNQLGNGTQLAKGKGGKFNQTKSALTSTTTSFARPRPTAKLPNTKSNNNLQSSAKFDQKYSNIYEKSSGKAPKQVKDGAYNTPRPSPPQSTVNPSILKMFERYEKIEEIFPELEPHRESNNPVYFTVSNGKPSRENSKSFSSFVSSFDSTMPQKKNTPVDRSESRQKESVDRNGKGTICSNHYFFAMLALSSVHFSLVAFNRISSFHLIISSYRPLHSSCPLIFDVFWVTNNGIGRS